MMPPYEWYCVDETRQHWSDDDCNQDFAANDHATDIIATTMPRKERRITTLKDGDHCSRDVRTTGQRSQLQGFAKVTVVTFVRT